jgi:hypothetical protein
VTFFWNGNRGGPFNKDLEKHKEVGISRAHGIHVHNRTIPCLNIFTLHLLALLSSVF